jgi:hypothetical protein
MTFNEFKTTLSLSAAPGLPDLLTALWYDAKGDWESSHNIAQDIHSSEGSRVHAYLHRKEGDLANAAYWYQRAGRKMPAIPIEEEWDEMVREFLEVSGKSSES